MKKNYNEEYRVIGGMEQYLLHYPATGDAPVLLFLHGGPGAAESGLGYLHKRWWGDLFHIVHWDQRGAGKTFWKNRKNLSELSSPEIFFSDLNEVVAYLCERYQTKQLALMGHGWGTILGSLYTLQHPKRVSLYIGVSQVVDMRENEIFSMQAVRQAIIDAGKLGDLEILGSLEGYPPEEFTEDNLIQMESLHKLLVKYKLTVGFHPKWRWALIKSPNVRLSHLDCLFGKAARYNRSLLPYVLNFSLRSVKSYKVPVCYIAGSEDYYAAAHLTQEYFETIEAPQKKLHIIPGGGHNTPFDTPDAFVEALRMAREMLP